MRQRVGLSGEIFLKGDKSVSHRALFLSALSRKKVLLKNLGQGQQLDATRRVVAQMNVDLHEVDEGLLIDAQNYHVQDNVFDCGHSGTTARLLLGILSGHSGSFDVIGNVSLSKRPMLRVVDPLMQMGASFSLTQAQFLPLSMQGSSKLQAIHYNLPVASAQVKSALLLAGLFGDGELMLSEPFLSRTHTEKMLKMCGVKLDSFCREDGLHHLRMRAGQKLNPPDVIDVPGDVSSAAFLIVAALLVPHSHIVVRNLCVSKPRDAFLTILQKMGGDIRIHIHDNGEGEDVADVEVFSSQLSSCHVTSKDVPGLIDEYPILVVASLFAQGTSIFEGLSELRYKESNRLEGLVDGLRRCGASVVLDGDVLTVQQSVLRDAIVDSYEDHRMAMAFVVLRMLSQKNILIDDLDCIDQSFPDFFSHLEKCGASF